MIPGGKKPKRSENWRSDQLSGIDCWDLKYVRLSVKWYRTLQMETVWFSELLEKFYQTVRCHIREG